MKFMNPYIPQLDIHADPKWKGELKGYYLFLTFWEGHYLKAFVSREEYEASDLPVKVL